jgi:two-component system chemotaxis response regulator CheB
LFELDGEPAPRYRCRVGHAWSPQSLLVEQSEAFESALWIALRVLEEKVALTGQMADSAERRGSRGTAERYLLLSAEAERAAGVIRGFIHGLNEGAEKRAAEPAGTETS